MAEDTLQARAVQKYLRRSPRKVRLVVDSVRGENVADSLRKLNFIKKAAASDVAKVIKSAAANLRDKYPDERIDDEDLQIKEIYVDEGTTMKRIQPAAMGRANTIRKRTSHITVVVEQKNEELINE